MSGQQQHLNNNIYKINKNTALLECLNIFQLLNVKFKFFNANETLVIERREQKSTCIIFECQSFTLHGGMTPYDRELSSGWLPNSVAVGALAEFADVFCMRQWSTL